MDGAILERRDRSDASDDFNWVIRAKIQSVIDDQYHRAKSVVEQHLTAYYGHRQGNVFARAGVTPRVTVDLFESQAINLAGMLADNVRTLSRNARAYQMIADVMAGFITYIDLVIGRIGPRIDLEMRDLARSKEAPREFGEMWAESRARIVENLKRQRPQFAAPAKPAPLPALAPTPIPPPLPERDEVAAMPEPEMALPAAPEPDQPAPTMRDWHEMWAEIAAQLCTDKLQPECQADIGLAMSECLANLGVACDGPDLEEAARRLWRKLAAGQRVNSTLSPDDDREMGLGAAMFDSLAWQSGSFRIPGLTSYTNIHPPVGELQYSMADAREDMRELAGPDESNGLDPIEPEPDSPEDRYFLSRSLGPGPGLTAPFIDLG